MRFNFRAKRFAKLFFVAMSASLSMGLVSSVYADDAVSAVQSDSAPLLNELFSKQWVRVDADHSVSGSLVHLSDDDKIPLAGLPVALIRDGEVAYRAMADANGEFKFENVEVGSYSLVTRTNESIAAFSLQVLGSENSHLSNSVEVRVIRPAGPKVKEILRAHALPTYAMRNDSAVEISKDPLQGSRSFSQSHLVKLDANGKLVGQLGSLSRSNLSDITVYVLKNGEEIARATTNKEGAFSIEGLQPGSYGFLAAGNAGFAATSFQLVNPATAGVGADGSRFVSIFGHACGCMNVEVVECCEVAVCEQPMAIVETTVETVVEPCGEVLVAEGQMAPSCGCGGGWGGYGGWGHHHGFGGGGGGGGGFGGVGGWGGLATIGGLVALGIIAADDNNDAPVVSPVGP